MKRLIYIDRRIKLKTVAHLIFTRYNLHLTFENKKSFSGNDNSPRGRSWHMFRQQLFNKFYYPLAILQKDDSVDFLKFYIYLDFNHEKLSGVDLKDNIELVKCTPATSEYYVKHVRKMISHFLTKYDIVIATRLDNDDGLSPDYTNFLLNQINSRPSNLNYVMYFNKSIQYVEKEFEFYNSAKIKNPNVLSFVNFKENEIISPAEFNHARIDIDHNLNVVVNKGGKPMFIQVIHKHNVGNSITKRNRVQFKINSFLDKLSNPIYRKIFKKMNKSLGGKSVDEIFQ